MKKQFFFSLLVFVSFLVFFKGLLMFGAFGEKVVNCGDAFNDRCTQPGQCSYNTGHAASNCVITCKTVYEINGKEELLTMEAKCGSWKDDSGGSGTGGSGTGGSSGDGFDPEGDGTPWWDPWQ